MTTCDTCGNEYDDMFTMTRGGTTRHFDSLECAITSFAPSCARCGCRVIGHGVQVDATVFCCAHCARDHGHESVTDRASSATGR
ncbi:hypothetical protein [Tsukamurella pulmonis]|uniref:hypothetical protein n=1 Tax=Tsukamurella pulmonis TaxID=47312 RepID=UPI001EDE2B2E|nr:hypothetical protein [Tsukamurella pulmonis]